MKTIDEIEERYKVDLTLLFKNEEEIKQEKETIKSIKTDLCAYKNKVLESSDNLYNVLTLLESYDRKITKVYVYYFFKSDLDLTDDKTREEFELFDNIRLDDLKDINFVSIELKKITKSLWKKFKVENPKLGVYDYYFKEIIRLKKYKLKDNEERFLTNLYPILGSEENVYDILTNADFKAKDVIVNGKSEKLTGNNYSKFLVSPDRDVRKQAYENMMSFYKEHNHTLSELYKMFVKQNNLFSKLSHFKNSFDSEMINNGLKEEVYLKLIDIVKTKKPFLDRFAIILKKDLGYGELYSYDMLYNKHSNKEYDFLEAVDMCIESLKNLGVEYTSLFKKGIDNRYIDVYPYEHKNSMQYCVTSYGLPPIIHMNYNNTFDDINTLIHEMGHSINSVLTSNNMNYVYGEPSTLVTETAAITNEILLANYVLNTSDDKEEKLFIINHLVNMVRSTIFFQVNIAEFELEAVLKDEQGEILTSEVLNSIWSNTTKNYTSNNVIINEELSKSSWARIPHIFQDGGFYVYKYALGLCLASSIASKILSNDKKFINKYIEFLSNGSSMSDYDMFKKLGLDITKSDYIESAFELFNTYLDKYEELISENE